MRNAGILGTLYRYSHLVIGANDFLRDGDRVLCTRTNRQPLSSLPVADFSIHISDVEDPHTWYVFRQAKSSMADSLAEWAIARLQAEASQHTLIHASSAADQKDTGGEPVIIGYFSYEGTPPGRVALTTTSIHSSSDASEGADWHLSFADLQSMHKVPNQCPAEILVLTRSS